jgi:hypothetical protein
LSQKTKQSRRDSFGKKQKTIAVWLPATGKSLKAMKTKLIIAVLILITVPGIKKVSGIITPGGKGHVAGKIISQNSNQPVKEASVELFSTNDSTMVAGTITDATGYFTIFHLDTGRYYVVIRTPESFKTEVRSFSIGPAASKIELGEIPLADADKKVACKRKARISQMNSLILSQIANNH